MSGELVYLLAELVVVCVFSPYPIVSQRTTNYCDNGDNEVNVMMTVISQMQQQLAEQRETILSMKQEVTQLKEERIRDHRSIEQLQQGIALINEVQKASCKYVFQTWGRVHFHEY